MRGMYLSLVALLLTGCATVYSECEGYSEGTEEFTECQAFQREYRQSIDWNNWVMCKRLYEQAGTWTICTDHTEKDHRPGDWSIGQDLSHWSCRFHLREYWEDY